MTTPGDRSGRAKTRLLFSPDSAALRTHSLREVFELTDRWPDKRAILIVPEQAKLDFEQAYLHASERPGLLMAEILSFRRLAARISGEVGVNTNRHLTASGQAMLLYRLLQERSSDLHNLHRLSAKPGYLHQIAAAMGDLRRFKIDAQRLGDLSSQLVEINLRNKIEDLALVMADYQSARTEIGLRDSDDELDDLAAQLASPPALLANRLDWLSQTAIWIVGFGELRNFTPQEYAVIEQLQTRCEQLTVTVMTDRMPSDRQSTEMGSDIFLPGRRTAYQLLHRLKPDGCLSVAPGWTAPAAELAAALLDEQAPAQSGCVRTGDYVRLVQATRQDDQITWLAGEIRRLVSSGLYRYQDLVVALTSPQDDLPRLRAVFSQFSIPAFLDQDRVLGGSALARTVASLLDIAWTGWTRPAVMRLLRAGLLTDDQGQVDALENDLLAHGLFRLDRYLAWLDDSPHNPGRERLADVQMRSRLAIFQSSIFSLVQTLVRQLSDSPTGQGKVAALADYLAAADLENQTRKQVDRLVLAGEHESALALAKSWNVLADVLAQLIQLAAAVPLSIESFRDLILTGFDNADSGVLPSALDQVAVGDLARSRQRTGKILFILGADAAHLPPGTIQEGLLKDQDRLSLSDVLGLELPNKARDQIFADQAMIFSLFTQATDQLVLIASSNDPSPYFTRLAAWQTTPPLLLDEHPAADDVRLNAPAVALNRVLEQCRQQIPSPEAESLQWTALARALVRAGYWPGQTQFWLTAADKLSVHLTEAAVSDRFGQVLKMSVSQLEQYAACPFRHFAAYGLALADRQHFEPESTDQGTLLHCVAEKTLLEWSRQTAADQDDGAIQAHVNHWLEQELDQVLRKTWEDLAQDPRLAGFFAPGQRASTGRRLERVARTSMAALLSQMAGESFRPSLFEWTFRPDLGNALELNLDDSHRVVLRGKIDRIDQRLSDGQAEFRIIDYKSGQAVVNLDTLYQGLAMQLPAYLAAFAASHPDQRATDACYFHFDQPIFNRQMPDRSMSAGSDQRLASHFKLRNLGLEPRLLNALTRHTLRRIRQWAGQIAAGEFSARPRRLASAQLPCRFCSYGALCGFDNRCNPSDVLPTLGQLDPGQPRRNKADLLARRLDLEDECESDN